MDREQPISVNNLYYFNAHTKTDDDVVETFIVRKNILSRILQQVEIGVKGKLQKHFLISGSRGMGKSTLLRRLEIAMQNESESCHLLPILFPEEQYNIDRLSKFWLNSLDALADNFEEENNFEETNLLDKLIEELTDLKDETKVSQRACDYLQEVCRKYRRQPVFLIDNFDILFDGISKEQRENLAKQIETKGSPFFIAASSHEIDTATEEEQLFFKDFEKIQLDRLSQSEMRELLLVLAEKTGKSEIFDDIYRKTAQLDALHSLTGGNPRIAIFMFHLLANGLSSKIFENLNALLDIITPLYKSNFEQLSKQSQIIVDALALNWDPCDLDLLSHITKLDNNTLASQLDRLVKNGWVERTGRFSEEKNRVVVRIKNYSLRERFFNIWYIMRRASRRQRGDLRSLTFFLETFYTPQHLAAEKVRIINLLKENIDTDRINYGLALSRAHNRGDGSEMEESIYRAILEQTDGNHAEISKYLNPDRIPEGLYDDFLVAEAKRWTSRINTLFENKEYEKARQFITSVLKRHPKNRYAHRMMAEAFYQEEKYDEAETYYQKTIAIREDDSLSWLGIALIQEKRNDFAAAEEAYQIALVNPNTVSYVSVSYINFLRKAERYNDAEDFLRIRKNEKPDSKQFAFLLLVILAEQLKLDELQSVAALHLLEFKDDYDYVQYLLAVALAEAGKHEHAVDKFKNITSSIFDDNAAFQLAFAQSLEEIGEFDLAYKRYSKALKITPKDEKTLFQLARLLKDSLNEYKAAEKAYKKLMTINDQNPDVWMELGDLYTATHKFKKALNAFTKATEIAPDYAKAWAFLALFQHYMNDEPEKAYIHYVKSLELQPHKNPAALPLADLCHFDLNKYEDADKYYRMGLLEGPFYAHYTLKYIILRLLMQNVSGAVEIGDEFRNTLDGDALSISLTEAVIAVAKNNFGNAAEAWKTALINTEVSDDTLQVLKYACAISVRYGFGSGLLRVFESSNAKQQLRPLYEATKSLTIDSVEYLNNIAEEIRDTARTIYDDMKYYLEDV